MYFLLTGEEKSDFSLQESSWAERAGQNKAPPPFTHLHPSTFPSYCRVPSNWARERHTMMHSTCRILACYIVSKWVKKLGMLTWVKVILDWTLNLWRHLTVTISSLLKNSRVLFQMQVYYWLWRLEAWVVGRFWWWKITLQIKGYNLALFLQMTTFYRSGFYAISSAVVQLPLAMLFPVKSTLKRLQLSLKTILQQIVRDA